MGDAEEEEPCWSLPGALIGREFFHKSQCIQRACVFVLCPDTPDPHDSCFRIVKKYL